MSFFGLLINNITLEKPGRIFHILYKRIRQQSTAVVVNQTITRTTCSTKSGQVYTSSYDAWGNVTTRSFSGTTATLSYDILDHFTEWNAGSTNQEWYIYDASGQRVLSRSTTSSGTSITVYAFGLEEHVYSSSGTNQWNTYYYRLGGRLLGSLDGNGTRFYLTDALGSILSNITNAAGGASVKGNQVFGPYGNARYFKGDINTAKGFTGQYHDGLTGLDYYNARYYDPVAGVFLSADSVMGNGSGANPYAYVGGNPETKNDPTGLAGCLPGELCMIGGKPTTLPGCDLSSCSGPPPSSNLVATGGGFGSVLQSGNPALVVVPTTSSSTSQQNNTNSCGGFSAADCTTSPKNALTQISGSLRLRITLGVNLGGIACTGGPCFSVPSSVGVSTEVNVPVSLTTVTPLVGCASLLSCVLEDQPVEEKSMDDPAVLELDLACSFTARTVVATDHGKQPISKLKAGEKVWAHNPKTHKMELQPIVQVWIHPDDDLVDLTITTATSSHHGKPANHTSEVVHTNQKHPFLTLEHGFLPVSKIKLGMHILRADGSVGVVAGWKIVPGTQVMYNLEVAQDHTFTVGTGQWVVHNCAQPSVNHLDVVPYKTDAPSIYEKHHGVLDVWARNNIPGYNRVEAPSLVLTVDEHLATRVYFAQWRIETTGSLTGYIDWKAMSPREIQSIAYGMFEAAGVPNEAVEGYFRAFNQYIYSLP